MLLKRSNDPDMLTVLAGLPQDETVFEYLTGCWKRLYGANRENSCLVRHPSGSCLFQGYSAEEKAVWKEVFEKLRRLIISYCGMTLEDPTMFPQPAGYASHMT